MNRVVLHIDRLVLHGVEAGDRHMVAADLEGALNRALSRPGGAGRLAELGHVSKLSLDAGRAQTAESLGSRAGRYLAERMMN